jgi:hypothetical protein
MMSSCSSRRVGGISRHGPEEAQSGQVNAGMVLFLPMKTIMIMFDSVKQRMLPPYGCD